MAAQPEQVVHHNDPDRDDKAVFDITRALFQLKADVDERKQQRKHYRQQSGVLQKAFPEFAAEQSHKRALHAASGTIDPEKAFVWAR